jgi:tetratricopeptide (TPR) repeat protein
MVAGMTSGTGKVTGSSAIVAGMKNFPLILMFGFLGFATAAEAADLTAARALREKKDFAGAIALLEPMALAKPKDAEVQLELGQALTGRIGQVGLMSKAGMAKRSLAAYERAAELDPRNVGARLALIQYYMQAPFFAGGDRAKAYATARELATFDAWQGNFWLMRLHLADREPKAALAACDALQKVEPASYRTLYQLGRTVALTGLEKERGVAALRQAVNMTPAANDPGRQHAFFRLGQILEAQGHQPEARSAFESAVVIDPKMQEAAERAAALKRAGPPAKVLQ